jgi:hypothetical protein
MARFHPHGAWPNEGFQDKSMNETGEPLPFAAQHYLHVLATRVQRHAIPVIRKASS